MGDFLKILDALDTRELAKEKAIQNIIVAYINDFEIFSDETSLINTLVNRNIHSEIRSLNMVYLDSYG